MEVWSVAVYYYALKTVEIHLGWVYWGYIGCILGLYWGYMGVILGLYRVYIGIMEKKIEATI